MQLTAPAFSTPDNLLYNARMSGLLLHTKLMMPVIRPSLVPRPHLRQRLDDGLGPPGQFARKLTLITAPAEVWRRVRPAVA